MLNGTNNKAEIQSILPHNIVINGCVYLVSRLKEPGVIENSGNIESFYFGTDNQENEKLTYLESLLLDAKIDAHNSNKISSIIWEKFIFLSPLATGTTAYNKSIGELLESKEHLAVMTAVVDEVSQIAKAKKIALNEDITEKTIAKLKLLTKTITSSMHSDFELRKPKNELETLTNYVISEGEKYGIKTPTYKYALAKIKELSKTTYS